MVMIYTGRNSCHNAGRASYDHADNGPNGDDEHKADDDDPDDDYNHEGAVENGDKKTIHRCHRKSK